MFSATKYNKGEGSKFNYKLPSDAPYKKVADLDASKTYVVRALYVSTKGNYGETPIAIIDGAGVYLPKHLLETVKEMIADVECVDAINQGCVGFSLYTYEDTTHGKGTCYSVDWKDVIPTVSNEMPWEA